jgi:hypothetical protein
MHEAMIRALALATAIGGCAGASTIPAAPAPPAPRGPYLGEVAGTAPKMFAPGVVSRRYQELNAAFSPSGDELVFTITEPPRTSHTLVHMVRQPGGAWSAPAVLPFSGRYSDADPIFTADGARLLHLEAPRRTGRDCRAQGLRHLVRRQARRELGRAGTPACAGQHRSG